MNIVCWKKGWKIVDGVFYFITKANLLIRGGGGGGGETEWNSMVHFYKFCCPGSILDDDDDCFYIALFSALNYLMMLGVDR